MSDSHDFERALHAPVVTGLEDRRQFKRADPISASDPNKSRNESIWSDTKWVDKQRHFLQAYEYLCHIAEAKEWIEDVIQKTIAATIELEEALRDGVLLAEIVQTLYPHQTFKIFRHPRLQYRHTDNIALFFTFLDQIELPDIFRFEMIDLYEKKNIPKVIYCIHALSWLLFKSEIVDFHIGNLVGQLEFEHHDLDEMHKGLEKANVKMPSFSAVGASFGEEVPEESQLALAAPEPKPSLEPLVVETEEERIQRELLESEDIYLDLQAQVKGAVVRGALSQMMEDLWCNEYIITDLQSRLRGDWARQIISYRLDMRRFAVYLQSFSRGLLFRLRFQQDRRDCVAMAPRLIKLQSIFRANKARSAFKAQRAHTHREQSGVQYLQSTIRGTAVRRQMAAQVREIRRNNPRILSLQGVIRGFLVREDTNKLLRRIDLTEPKVKSLQTRIRGMLLRGDINHERSSLRASEDSICLFQAYIRGLIKRRSVASQRVGLENQSRVITATQSLARKFMSRMFFSQLKSQLAGSSHEWLVLQNFSRGQLLRRSVSETKKKLANEAPGLILLQALIRGRASRNSMELFKKRLRDQVISITKIQSFIRGYNVRDRVDMVLTALDESLTPTLSLQSQTRGFLLRQRQKADKDALEDSLGQILELEGLMRGALLRVSIVDLLGELDDHASEIEGLQALASGSLVRVGVEQDLASLDAEEDVVEDFQTRIRAFIVRRRFAEKRQYYLDNINKVVKVQSIFRGKVQGEAYRSLTSGKNPPVATVKGFVHLLNDSNFDFDEEIEFERMRKATVQQVRQNEVADQYVSQLDIKIALLVRNKITLDEVVKHQKMLGGSAGALITNSDISSKDPFDLKAMNKTSRQKLEKFQELYFYLQTQPQYLARLCRRLQEQALPEKELERTKHLFMGLFGYAQKRREEYYLVKLMVKSLQGDIKACPSLQEYKRYNPFWDRLFGVYSKSPKDRKFLRDVFGGIVKDHIIENPDLDLESDPLQIYQSMICEEELQTGQKSMRPLDIPKEDAVRDPQTREIFVANLQDLRDIVDQFYMTLEENLHKMPFGVRHIAQMIYEGLIMRFPEEDRGLSLQLAGRWIWRSYLRPALLEPERHGAADRGLTQEQKRNLADIAKVVEQAVSGRLFGNENVYLQPLNPWLANSIQVLGSIWARVIQTQKAESYFDIDEFNDIYAKQKPTLYVKITDLFSIHRLVLENAHFICAAPDDPLREVLRDLDAGKNQETELVKFSSAEICLTLAPKHHKLDDPEAESKALYMETKRCILYIIRVQSGANLLEILVKQPTVEDRQLWYMLVRDELSTNSIRRGAYSDGALTDIGSMSYEELKATALENILALEQKGWVSRQNQYQDILNAIAVDIRTKHRRKIQRQKEIESVRLTWKRLNEQAIYLDQQIKTYNDYIEQAMMTLHNKKGKKRFLIPFTKQWDHQRELQRSGRVFKFGSYKYSARNLANRGVLVFWKGYTEAQWDRLDLTISSNEVGVFMIDGSRGNVMVPGANAQVPLDDLLQAQYNNSQYMDFFECTLRVNVNLFLHLIMKKFYND